MRLLMFLAALWSVSAFAHHNNFSRAEHWKVLEGTVVGFSMVNPHASLQLEAPNENGKIVVYDIDLRTPAFLLRMHVNRATFREGDRISVNVWRIGGFYSNVYFGVGFRTADGTLLGDFSPDW